jgi:membrane protease YdiL (CAAX protease family)
MLTQPSAAAAVPLDRSTLAWRVAELLAVFVALPLAVRAGLLPGPRLLLLGVITAGAVALLWKDPAFDRSRLWSGRPRAGWRGILLRTSLAGLVITALVLWLDPARFLAMPLERTGLWLAGLALYPILSAWPQEVLYRVFFFERYGALFGAGRTLVVASGLAFAILHLVYPNLVAPLLSLPAGMILAWRYRRTGALGPVWLEHSLYGLLLFSLGLGNYFFDGRG